MMPPNLLPDHWHAPAAKRLRAYARRNGHGSARPLVAAEARALDNWLAMMKAENLVVAYDPEHPPNPASPTYGGWYYVTRDEHTSADKITAYDPA